MMTQNLLCNFNYFAHISICHN